LHFAGFIDPGFEGDVVLEVRPHEESSMELRHGNPISTLDVFRNRRPDKVYGKEIGSHYQGQKGPKTSKHFMPFDYGMAAKNYKKLDREVLCQDARLLMNLRKNAIGFEFLPDNKKKALEQMVSGGFFQSRYDCEEDPSILQLIPYVLVFGPDETVFHYVRAQDIKQYGDRRLFGKHSIGLGGHINKIDGPDFVANSMRRELGEEVTITGNCSEPLLVGTLFAEDKPVDTVHFGLIHALHTDGKARPKERSITTGNMAKIEKLVRGNYDSEDWETWSKMLIPSLYSIYRLSENR
jgi:predicted NUDIX family phosphoesterase